MERKEFIKKSCTACIAISAGWMLTELASCAHLPIYKAVLEGNKISVPLALFATGDMHIISPQGFDYDIAIRKEPDASYTTLLMRCTHADNQLLSTGRGFVCNLHGSTFNKEGAVTQGPAEQSLKKYPTTTDANNIIITIN